MAVNAAKLKEFFRESREELRKVNWPNRQETVRYTIFVVIFSLGLAALLGLLDAIFIKVLEALVL